MELALHEEKLFLTTEINILTHILIHILYCFKQSYPIENTGFLLYGNST